MDVWDDLAEEGWVMSREKMSSLVDFSSVLGGEGGKVEAAAKEKANGSKGSSFFGGLFGIKSVDNGRAGGGGLTGLGRRHVPELGTYTTGEVQVLCEKVSLRVSLLLASLSSFLRAPLGSFSLNLLVSFASSLLLRFSQLSEPPIRNPRPQANPSLRPLSLDAKRLQVPRPRLRSWSWKGMVRYREGMV